MTFRYCSAVVVFRSAVSSSALHSLSFPRFFKDTLHTVLNYAKISSKSYLEIILLVRT